jgi:hypothetical protein
MHKVGLVQHDETKLLDYIELPRIVGEVCQTDLTIQTSVAKNIEFC